jgi:hypothetical protein
MGFIYLKTFKYIQIYFIVYSGYLIVSHNTRKTYRPTNHYQIFTFYIKHFFIIFQIKKCLI